MYVYIYMYIGRIKIEVNNVYKVKNIGTNTSIM